MTKKVKAVKTVSFDISAKNDNTSLILCFDARKYPLSFKQLRALVRGKV